MEGGAATLTVTQILRKLDISNRVFYNRFPNIETVLDIVYRNTIVKIRSALESPIDIMEDFFEKHFRNNGVTEFYKGKEKAIPEIAKEIRRTIEHELFEKWKVGDISIIELQKVSK